MRNAFLYNLGKKGFLWKFRSTFRNLDYVEVTSSRNFSNKFGTSLNFA